MLATARPMLQNFLEYKKLTVPLLQGMARLVELSPSLFTDKVTFVYFMFLFYLFTFMLVSYLFVSFVFS
jgi:hypothetical protein